MPNVTVTPRLKEIIAEKKFTQIELAELAKVTQPFISRFDSVSNYNIHNLISLARALNMTVEELFIIEDI